MGRSEKSYVAYRQEVDTNLSVNTIQFHVPSIPNKLISCRDCDPPFGHRFQKDTTVAMELLGIWIYPGFKGMLSVHGVCALLRAMGTGSSSLDVVFGPNSGQHFT